MLWSSFKNKRIGLYGMGREGQSTLTALHKYAAPLSVVSFTDEDAAAYVKNVDIIIKSPGVSLYKPLLQQALAEGVHITSATNLFMSNKPPSTRVIAVTGTKGKSTTASLMAHVLTELGCHVGLGGNIGVPLPDLLEETPDWVVAELSSYQCADFCGKPDAAILLNLYPEHLQWHGSHETYYRDKCHMVCRAGAAFVNGANEPARTLTQPFHPIWFNVDEGFSLKDGFFCDGIRPLFPVSSLPLKGEHNAQNALAILAVLKHFGFSPMAAESAFASFQALPHRLQFVRSRFGLDFVDDSISTTPETAVAALRALYRPAGVTLIAGGFDRGQDYQILVTELLARKSSVRLIAMPDTGKRLAEAALSVGIETYRVVDMAAAVDTAVRVTPQGGLVLLSPAAPSYNLYRNFEARGDDFKQKIDALKIA